MTTILPTAQRSIGTSQSWPYPARPEKVMASAGQHTQQRAAQHGQADAEPADALDAAQFSDRSKPATCNLQPATPLFPPVTSHPSAGLADASNAQPALLQTPAPCASQGARGSGAELQVESCRLQVQLDAEVAANGSPDEPEIASPVAKQPATCNLQPATILDRDWAEAEAAAQLCRQFLALRADHAYSLNQAARACGKSPSMFSGENSILARYQRGGVAALLPKRGDTGAKPQITVPDWFIPAAKFFYLLTNRNRDCGSVPEAIRRVISLPATPPHWDHKVKSRLLAAIGQESLESRLQPANGRTVPEPAKAGTPNLPSCPPDLREQILARERAGKPLLPPRIMQQISAPAATVRQYRHKKNAGLDFLCAPGTMMWIKNADGSRRFIRAGDILECDDGTINLPCVVPWSIRGCECSEAFGVKVGRFQFLRSIDAATRYRPGYSYVMRPRGSYRQEDILALLARVCGDHGKWRELRFERGAWKGNRIKDVCERMGSRLHTVYSPHAKPFIEAGFNQDWTKLSPMFPNVDLGRFMGETEEVSQLLLQCKKGKEDPRKHFPMLGDVLAAFRLITAEENLTPINSETYGRWVPKERWDTQRAQTPMEPLDPKTSWMFSPWMREWTVRGMLVGGKVRLFEELSVPFDFSALGDWSMTAFHGARVRCYFDPFDPTCHATIVLAQNHGTHRAGQVLGQAEQINEVAGYARLVLGWSENPAAAGRLARQKNAASMRSEVRTIMGATERGISTMRDGVATIATAEIGSPGHLSSGDKTPPRTALNRGTKSDPPGSPGAEERIARATRFEQDNPLEFL